MGKVASPILGPLIVEHRQARGWSPRELARRAQLNERLLHEIERHRRGASEESLRKLAAVLGLNGDHVVLLAGKVPERILERGFTPAAANAACACLSAPSASP